MNAGPLCAQHRQRRRGRRRARDTRSRTAGPTTERLASRGRSQLRSGAPPFRQQRTAAADKTGTEREHARIGIAKRDTESCIEDPTDAQPGESSRKRDWDSFEVRGRKACESPDADLPRSSGERSKGNHVTRRAVECRKCQRHDANDDDAVDESGPTCEEWHGDRQEGNEEQWIEKIELFLHQQRPIVVYRGLWLRVEEVWLNRIEMNVARNTAVHLVSLANGVARIFGRPGAVSATKVTIRTRREPGIRRRDAWRRSAGRCHLFRGLELTKKEARMRKPEMTKKTSSPTIPPGTEYPTWKRMMMIRANARRPSRSGR